MFNVRVYGVCIYNNQLLVVDELIKGMEITKLPGGGLEFGEGTHQCLLREFLEETGQEVEIVNHFYTTDFFVSSAFNNQSQVISIYYTVRFKSAPQFKIANHAFAFDKRQDNAMSFRWIKLPDVNEQIFTFPIDKKVAQLIAHTLK